MFYPNWGTRRPHGFDLDRSDPARFKTLFALTHNLNQCRMNPKSLISVSMNIKGLCILLQAGWSGFWLDSQDALTRIMVNTEKTCSITSWLDSLWVMLEFILAPIFSPSSFELDSFATLIKITMLCSKLITFKEKEKYTHGRFSCSDPTYMNDMFLLVIENPKREQSGERRDTNIWSP